MGEATKSAGIRGFAAENGWLLAAFRVWDGGWRRMRDAMLGRRLKTRGFRVGGAPKLLGLAHMHLGNNFSGGNHLWLEAVTSFAGERLEPRLVIGDDCNVSDSVHIGCANRITIGDGFLCGSRVLIIDHGHGFYGETCLPDAGLGKETPSDPAVRPNLRRLSAGGSVVIGRNVWLGDGCVILPGAEIGDGAVIGANSLVRGVVPARSVAAGSPARVLRRWDEATRGWTRVRQPATPDRSVLS